MSCDSPDVLAWPRLAELAACVCATIEEAELPPLCFCGVLPGDAVALDYVDNCGSGKDGMAWVRLVSIYPYLQFPLPIQSPMPCGAPLALAVEVGLVRTYPVRSDGKPIPAAEMEQLTKQQMDEMQALRRAINCCFDDEAFIGSYTPIGPQGGAFGGIWNAVLRTD